MAGVAAAVTIVVIVAALVVAVRIGLGGKADEPVFRVVTTAER